MVNKFREKDKSNLRDKRNLCCVESVEVWDWESRENGRGNLRWWWWRELWTVRACMVLVHLERWRREGNINGDGHVARWYWMGFGLEKLVTCVVAWKQWLWDEQGSGARGARERRYFLYDIQNRVLPYLPLLFDLISIMPWFY